MQKGKWLFEEALQIAEKRKDVKGKGEKVRYTLLNAEFQRISKKSEVAQSCPTLCDPMDSSPPGSSVHGILPARILEWVAISFSRGSSNPGIEPRYPRLQADALTSEPPVQIPKNSKER